VVNVRVTDARQHDRKAFELPTDVRSVLWLMDHGYSDHKLFAQIADGKGSFIIRLKSTSQPVVTAIRSGLAKAHQGQPRSRALPYFGVVDVDARFTVFRGTRSFRVIGIPVADTKQGADWSGSRPTYRRGSRLPRSGPSIACGGPLKRCSGSSSGGPTRRTALGEPRRGAGVHRRNADRRRLEPSPLRPPARGSPRL
jgi:hypothetical protein